MTQDLSLTLRRFRRRVKTKLVGGGLKCVVLVIPRVGGGVASAVRFGVAGAVFFSPELLVIPLRERFLARYFPTIGTRLRFDLLACAVRWGYRLVSVDPVDAGDLSLGFFLGSSGVCNGSCFRLSGVDTYRL